MLGFLSRSFKRAISVLAVLNIILMAVLGAIAGGSFAYSRASYYNAGSATAIGGVVGLAAGIVIALVFDILYYGLCAQIIMMEENTEAVRKSLSNIESSLSANQNKEN